jgi:serine/threonine protein phosphatase PrpC
VAWKPKEDLLLLFTDGLSDTLAAGGRTGEDLVLDTAVRHRFAPASEIVEALFELQPEAERPGTADDRTALVVRV